MKIIKYSLLIVLLFFFEIQSAYSYFNPSTADYIIQIIIMVGVGASLTIKIYWFKIKNTFKRLYHWLKK